MTPKLTETLIEHRVGAIKMGRAVGGHASGLADYIRPRIRASTVRASIFGYTTRTDGSWR